MFISSLSRTVTRLAATLPGRTSFPPIDVTLSAFGTWLATLQPAADHPYASPACTAPPCDNRDLLSIIAYQLSIITPQSSFAACYLVIIVQLPHVRTVFSILHFVYYIIVYDVDFVLICFSLL